MTEGEQIYALWIIKAIGNNYPKGFFPKQVVKSPRTETSWLGKISRLSILGVYFIYSKNAPHSHHYRITSIQLTYLHITYYIIITSTIISTLWVALGCIMGAKFAIYSGLVLTVFVCTGKMNSVDWWSKVALVGRRRAHITSDISHVIWQLSSLWEFITFSHCNELSLSQHMSTVGVLFSTAYGAYPVDSGLHPDFVWRKSIAHFFVRNNF